VTKKISFRGILVLTAATMALPVLSACGVGEASVATETPTVVTMPVVTRLPLRGDAYAYHSGTVNLETDSEADVVAKVGGEIVEILVEEGEIVKAGQIVARLDDARLRFLRDQARADLNKLTQEYRRNVQLHERGLVSEGAFENLRYDLEALDAAYKLADLELDYANIRAAIDGVVAEKVGRIGNTVSAGQVVVRISNSGSLLAYLHVPQRDLFQFNAGQTAELSLDALPGETHEARILRINPRVDSETGTVKVTLGVDNLNGNLRPGMFARAKIVYDVHNDAILIPREAVVAEDAQPAVFVVEDGVARLRTVTTGLASGANVEVTSGLEGSEKVVVIGQGSLRDGTPVSDSDASQRI
jgi:membrane fusion protein (multidrug efflux system)